MEKKLKNLLSQILGVSAQAITDDSGVNTISTWDSFNGLLIATELERVFEVKFTMEEIVSVKTVKDIKDALKRHNVTENDDD
jgi:acyl carrier protein